MFDDLHLFKLFNTFEERRKYWIGRLIISRVPIRKNLVEYVPADTVGLVEELKGNDTIGYTLVVRWSNGANCPCYQYDVFSHNKGGKLDKV